MQINTSSEKEIMKPKSCSSFFDDVPNLKSKFTPGEQFESLCLRIPNAFGDGPLKAAGFYAKWIKSKNHGDLTEQEMRDLFTQAMFEFA
jgi:hypothetical protein